MAAVSLSSALDTAEIDSIPNETKNKLEKLLNQRLDEIQSLKSKYEKLRVNSEQQYFDIEKQLITSNGKLETEVSQKASLQVKLEELEKKFTESTKKLHELQEKRDAFQSSEHEYTSTINQLEIEKRDINNIANKRNKEIERLNAEIEELTQKITTANNEKCEAQVKVGELESNDVSRTYREKRLEAEKAQLEKQVEWFNQQLTDKTNQLSSVRMEKTNHVLELQSSLEEKTQELTHQTAVVDSLKESLQKQSERMEATLEKLKEEREGQVQIEEQFRQELDVQKRLVSLYKASSDENDEQVTELTGAVEEFRKMLKDSSEALSELETQKTEEIKELQMSLNEKADTIEKLETELKNANELIVAVKKGSIPLSDNTIETLAPSAAATSKLLKSGMSLTQIYSEYIEATDALREQREENKRLNLYMEQIFQEIEEKAPLLKKQKEDYETALQNLEQMTAQLDTVMLECEKLRVDSDDMKRRYGHIQRECSRYQQSSQDLSKQVQRLLKEVEELRGGRVVREEADVSSTEVSSSSIISEKLVTFRNIEELQKQNEKLIEVCRDLSEKKEKEESEAASEKMQEMKEQLEFAMSELDLLKDARNRQAAMVESIVRQRDMYRVLLQQGGSMADVSPTSRPQVTSTPKHPAQPTGRGGTTTPTQSRIGGGDGVGSPTVSRRELQQAQEALKELKAEFDEYKKDRSDNEKLLNETAEKAKKGLADMRVNNAKLTTQLSFATERYKIVMDNVAGYKKEINLLQDRNHVQASTIHKHESAIANLKEELMGAKENVARWQVQVENLKKEKELVKMAENRLSMELDSIRREHSAQAMLTASLQAIQNNLERSEFEAKTRYTNQVEGLERELSNLRRRLETLLEEKTQQSTSWEGIVKTVHLELKQEKEKVVTAQTKADNAVLELETVKQELSTCEAKLAAAEIKLEKLATAEASREETPADVESRVETEAMKDLKNQIALQQNLIKGLRQKVEAEKKHANQFKTIADNVEQSMKEQTEASKDVEKQCEKKIQAALSEKTLLEKRVELLEQDLAAANAECSRLSNESHSLHGDLRKQVMSLQHQLEEAVKQRQEAIANSETALEDSKKQAEIASQAQDKYQKELMLHAADVEALAAVRKQMEDINEHLQQTQEETTTYEKQLADAKTSWTEQERVYKEEVKIMEKRCEELNKQNTVLHEQMGKLSAQVVSIQQKARRESLGGANTSFSEEQGKTSDQLLEVVKFLRREKEIAETKLQVVQTECTRVKQRCAIVEKQAEEATKSLSEERQNAQLTAETAANQLELMRKVSNFNVLTDSNKLLRDERDQLLNSRHELEAKMRKLESEIEPLQQRLRELDSEKEAVTVERDSLQDEVNRWKNRTSNLIEQSNKTDPEETKRLQQEKENMRKQLASVKEESFKHKTELTRVTQQCTSLQTELNTLKEQTEKINQELAATKTQVEEKVKESEQKTTTINRLKQIGRKYKEQADKINKELEDVRARAAGQESDKVNIAALEQNISELRNTIGTSNTKISTLETQFTEAQNEAQAATKRAEQMCAENMTLKEAQEKKSEELKQSQEQLAKLQTEVDELKNKTAEFDKKTTEFEKKSAQSRQVMQNARSKIIEQQALLRQLEVDKTELKNQLAAASGLGAKPDGAGSQDLSNTEDIKAQLDRLQTENSELHAKIHHLQRQLEQHKHSPSQGVAARPASSVAPSTSSIDAPKTANIKPMAPASSTSRQAAPSITSHSSHSSHSPAVKATASIRPMAISPTTSTLPVSGTPTATVMPTTVTQAEVEPMPGPSGLQQSSLPTVSGRVQIVEPQVIDRTPDTSGDQSEETAGVTNQAVVTPNIQQETAIASVSAVPSVATTIPMTMVNPVAPSTSSAVAVEVLPSVQQQQHTTGVTLGKRTREEDSLTHDESDTKRTRINTAQQQQPQQASTTLTQQQAPAQQLTQLGSSVGVVSAKPTAAAAPSSASSSVAWQQADTSTADSGNSGDDVIIMLSDEEEQQVEDNDDEEEEEEEDEDQIEEEGEEEEEDEDYEDEDDEDDDDDDDDDVEAVDEPDEIEVIGNDESSQPSQSADTAADMTSTQRPSATLQPLTAASVTQQDSANVAGRTQQIAPFMLGGQGNIFEEDDCTVPSTPTLAQPRRADGFAEALNSPAVNQRFLFGADNSNNQDLAQLESQRALGMDDTRMDLSQFNEGRSMPTTPTASNVSDVMMAFSETQAEGDSTEAFSTQSQQGGDERGCDPVEQQAEEEDDLLEGDAGEENEAEETASADMQGDSSNQPGTSKDDAAGASQDKPEGAAKPQIKKIVWDASPDTSSTGLASAGRSSVLGGQQQQQTRGIRRGGGLLRGRGRAQFSSGQSGRGFRPSRGGRGAL